ncbi:MAG: HupE/UreJ family protein [Hellea sp.]|nr:HupE/UreJ family protein [Hellea sp.]
MTRFYIAAICIFFCAQWASAHEVRPAFLKITETADAEYYVSWKQPVNAGKRLRLEPVFPVGCETTEPKRSFGSGTLVDNFEVTCDLHSGIIEIAGLENTLTDVFVEIAYLDGEIKRQLLKPSSPSINLSTAEGAKTSAYLWIGVEHILLGWDHLLFVIGLVLLVNRRQIIGVATSFTIAHSLTLALAAFGLINIPTRPVEILIAVSIVLLAVEIMRKRRGEIGLAASRPYLIGFIIGLIHGCGFASALSDIGLPQGTELLALLLFNIGVELGQFLIVALLVIFLAIIGKMHFNRTRITEAVMTYAIGGIAMFWVIDRLKDYIV